MGKVGCDIWEKWVGGRNKSMRRANLVTDQVEWRRPRRAHEETVHLRDQTRACVTYTTW